jgi:hypothetical protein
VSLRNLTFRDADLASGDYLIKVFGAPDNEISFDGIQAFDIDGLFAIIQADRTNMNNVQIRRQNGHGGSDTLMAVSGADCTFRNFDIDVFEDRALYTSAPGTLLENWRMRDGNETRELIIFDTGATFGIVRNLTYRYTSASTPSGQQGIQFEEVPAEVTNVRFDDVDGDFDTEETGFVFNTAPEGATLGNLKPWRESETAANIASAAAAINASGKYTGRVVWDTTNMRMLRASGSGSTADWEVVDGSAQVTPS